MLTVRVGAWPEDTAIESGAACEDEPGTPAADARPLLRAVTVPCHSLSQLRVTACHSLAGRPAKRSIQHRNVRAVRVRDCRRAVPLDQVFIEQQLKIALE